MQRKMPEAAGRQRLVNAAHRFARISREDPVKLFGLLYMLDLRLFRNLGRSCTGEVYHALADGPAPATLIPLLVMRDLGLDAGIGFLTSTDAKGPWPFESRHFCPHALAILNELEEAFGQAPLQNSQLDDANAWWSVYTGSRGVGATIPYEMTLGAFERSFAPGKSVRRQPGEPAWRRTKPNP